MTDFFDKKLFDAASDHPYECRCEICQIWWDSVPDEDDEDFDEDDILAWESPW